MEAERTPEQVQAQGTTAETPEAVSHQERIVIEPRDSMPTNEQYQIMYLPVYVSTTSAKMYVAGPLIQASQPGKPILKEFTESLNDAADTTSKAIQPFIKQMSDITNKAIDYLNTGFQSLISKGAKKFEKKAEKTKM